MRYVANMRGMNVIAGAAVLIVLIVAAYPPAQAQPGPSISVSYDFLPYQDIDEPIEMPDGSMVDDAQVRLSKVRTAITYPVMLSQGRTILFNELSYQQITFNYRKTTSLLDRLHSFSYTLTALHSLSEKWSLLAMGKSSIASDLEVEMAAEDFSFQTAAILNRHFSQKFSMGFGIAYSTQFGNGVPLPLLTFDWNNGAKWSARATLPSDLEVWYIPGERVSFGLLVTGDGDNFRFDPGSYRDTAPEPELRYTMMTIGSTARINLTPEICLNVEAGIIGLHRFEFYSGDTEVVSNDLEPSQYIRLGLQADL